MAEVMQNAMLRQKIEFSLAYLRRRWQAVPTDADEWASWDDIEKEVYQLEWGIPNSHLIELKEFARQGLLSADQQVKYEELLKLMAEHQPILEDMFAA